MSTHNMFLWRNKKNMKNITTFWMEKCLIWSYVKICIFSVCGSCNPHSFFQRASAGSQVTLVGEGTIDLL